jgi:predicted MFS family arabinose efflux permease
MPRMVIRTLVILSITQILNWAFLYYAFALWAPRIIQETGWSGSLVFGGYSLSLFVTGLASPFAGRLVDRHGGRQVMAAGTLLGASGLVLLAFSHEPNLYFAAFALMGLGNAGALYDPAFATLTQVAGSQARRAISTLTLAGGFASTVSWPLTLFLFNWFDWRVMALIYACVLVILCTPLHFFGLPRGARSDVRDRADTPSPIPPQPLQEQPVRGPEWQALGLFALVIMAHGFVTSSFSVHVIHVLDQWGLGEAVAVSAGALIGPAQVLARLIEMLYGRHSPALTLGVGSVALLPIAFIVLMLLPHGLVSAGLFALFYGASNGLLTIVRGLVPLALFGPEGYGRRLGLISGPSLVVKAIAPMTIGAVLSGYSVGMVLWIALGCAGLALAAMTVLFASQR